MIARMPPSVLAIDTATEFCSVAVLVGDRQVEQSERVGQRHSERALPMVQSVLASAGQRLSDIDFFAFGAGPGSFTGLRIACGIVQGLAYGTPRQVVAVGNLRALAARAFALVPSARSALIAIDARMHEAYCAIYVNDAMLTELRGPALERPDALARLAKQEGVDLVGGDALVAFANDWPRGVTPRTLPELRAGAGEIARLARIDAGRGLATAPERAMPLYVRDHVALTIEERQREAAR